MRIWDKLPAEIAEQLPEPMSNIFIGFRDIEVEDLGNRYAVEKTSGSTYLVRVWESEASVTYAGLTAKQKKLLSRALDELGFIPR